MIELLGIGVRKRDAWRLRRVCARFENRAFVAVLSSRRDERVTLLQVIAGREIPSEGRAWIDGIPLSRETAPRVRRRVAVVDLAGPMDRAGTAASKVLDSARALRGERGCLVIPEPDAHLTAEDMTRVFSVSRALGASAGLSVFVSLGDPALARHTDHVLRVADHESAKA